MTNPLTPSEVAALADEAQATIFGLRDEVWISARGQENVDVGRKMSDCKNAIDALRDAALAALAAAPAPTWISVQDRVPTLVDDEDVAVYTWDGKTVEEDTYGPEFDQPAGPVIGGWVRIGENFGDIHRDVTHWMLRSLPAAPDSAGTGGEGVKHG